MDLAPQEQAVDRLLELADQHHPAIRVQGPARGQSARQWRVSGHLERGGDGRTFLEVEARDRSGVPLTGLSFSAHLDRPIDKRADRSVALFEQGFGIYRGEAENLAPGQWDLVLEAEKGSERLFLSKNRVELK